MKVSQFNVFFPYEGQQVGYNSYSNDFIILNPELYELFNAASRDNIAELEAVHSEFYEALKDKQFIIPNDIDEVQKVKDLVYSLDQQGHDSFHLIINPTMNCNFKCWYCYETHIKESRMTSETSENIKLFIDKCLTDSIRHFSLSWFGGEPLLYFDKTVVPILEYVNMLIKERNITLSSDFTSNGLLINDGLLTKCKTLGITSFQITLDGHRNRHNEVRFVTKERGSYDEIISNIKLVVKYKIYVTVRINISEETLVDKEIENIMLDFIDLNVEDKKYITFSFHKVWQEEKNLHQDISNLIEIFKQNGFRTDYSKNLDSVRQSCYADKRNQATINYNGDVFKCTARDFTSQRREGVLNSNGMIDWNEKFEKRMNIKFKNKPCLECKILPICNGGCSQNALENENRDFCIHGYDESIKTDIVRNKFLYVLSDD